MYQLRSVLANVLIFTTMIAAIVILAANKVKAQQATRKSVVDSLIDAALQQQSQIMKAQQAESIIWTQIEEAKSNLSAAESALRSIQEDKPILKNTWKNLEIGEFEQRSDFERRRNESKAQEEHEFENRECVWRKQLTALEEKVSRLRASTKIQLKRLEEEAQTAKKQIATAGRELPVPSFAFPVLTSDLSFPKFNRETMCFEPVILKVPGTRKRVFRF
jgi:chromosome segregation ATPase